MKVFLGAPALLCPLGDDPVKVHQRMLDDESGLSRTDHYGKSVFAGNIGDGLVQEMPNRTRLESMMIQTIRKSLIGLNGFDVSNTALFICTTKGNIDHIKDATDELVGLSRLITVLRDEFKLSNTPQIISHACISGIVGVVTAARWIKAGNADNAIVVGGDLASEFTLSGFLSLHAVSGERCKPYDKNRDGINLGEAAASLVLSKDKVVFKDDSWIYSAGNVTNDANHISGPSRTGEGLYRSITKTLNKAENAEFDFISAHGTGTVFNDEMESIAFDRSGISSKPIHSLKWYLGHTLGAAGLIETVIGLECLRTGQIIKSGGFKEEGTSKRLNVVQPEERHFDSAQGDGLEEGQLNSFLKTASGFGGCNASILISNE
ncbi:MAG: 3-oxoacyl-[acyl-carrier-protein] synthase-1 [Bacteroidia bacterium]|jgi:3-oxoacyl-[acyl-carrier-protein] synthase-1